MVERKENGSNPWWLLFKQANGEITFVGPYKEQTAKILAEEHGSRPDLCHHKKCQKKAK